MRKIYLIFMLTSIFSTSLVFADSAKNMSWHSLESKSCAAIAHACKSAGFDKNKKFWVDCMKPIILGKTVKGVTIDSATVQTCRTDKIEAMKKELAEFENVKSNQ